MSGCMGWYLTLQACLPGGQVHIKLKIHADFGSMREQAITY